MAMWRAERRAIVSSRWIPQMRKPAIALGAALVVSMVTITDSTFAQVSLHRDLTLSDTSPVAAPNAGAPLTGDQALALPTTNPPLSPGLIDLGSVPAVSAHQMSLVALASAQVELAKTPAGAQAVAQTLIDATYKWNSSQISCLNALWNAESHWNFKAHNRRSGAHGIPQALPADKMEVIAMDWRTNPITQIKWGLRYISVRYGTPCVALATHHRIGSY